MRDDESLYPGAVERRRARVADDLARLAQLHALQQAGTLRYPAGLGYIHLRRCYPVEAAALDAAVEKATAGKGNAGN
jgi:hypothetical protein